MKLFRYLFLFLVVLSVFSCEETQTALVQEQVILQPDNSSGIDALISSKEMNSNFGKSNDASLIALKPDGVLSVTRFLLKFDLSEIPENAVITKAYLSLYSNDTENKHIGENYFLIKRITSDWSETEVSWQKQPMTTETNQISVARFYSEEQDFTNIDISNLVKDELFFGNNYGFLIKLQSEKASKVVSIASSDHPNSSLHPKLEINYVLK